MDPKVSQKQPKLNMPAPSQVQMSLSPTLDFEAKLGYVSRFQNNDPTLKSFCSHLIQVYLDKPNEAEAILNKIIDQSYSAIRSFTQTYRDKSTEPIPKDKIDLDCIKHYTYQALEEVAQIISKDPLIVQKISTPLQKLSEQLNLSDSQKINFKNHLLVQVLDNKNIGIIGVIDTPDFQEIVTITNKAPNLLADEKLKFLTAMLNGKNENEDIIAGVRNFKLLTESRLEQLALNINRITELFTELNQYKVKPDFTIMLAISSASTTEDTLEKSLDELNLRFSTHKKEKPDSWIRHDEKERLKIAKERRESPEFERKFQKALKDWVQGMKPND